MYWAALLLWTVPASAAPETTLKVAVGDPEDSEMGVVGHAFKKYVEEKTGGKVEVQCFYGGLAGRRKRSLPQRSERHPASGHGGIANLVPFEKKLGLLTLPYLFANIDEVVAGTNGAPAELLNKYATKAGFRILTWTYTDFLLHLQLQAPHHQDGRHAGPEVPRAPERRADRRL